VERARYQDFDAAGEDFDLVTARAVGGHAELLAWARSQLTPGGRAVLWSTAEDEAQLRRLSGWRVLSSPLPSLARGRLVQLQPCFT
jgi:16S rRNA G527 N7-methylase RsmG